MKKILRALAILGLAVTIAKLLMYARKYKEPDLKVKSLNDPEKYFKKQEIHKKNVFFHDCGLKNKKVVAAAALVLLLTATLSQTFLSPFSELLKTSLLRYEPIEFNGMSPPVKRVPNWVELNENEYRLSYDAMPKSKMIDLPEFNKQKIKIGHDSEWNENPEERNMYITYSVLHMGDYKLQANHDTGSHVGVDFKIPIGTPIYSTANGVVEKVENITTGFGKHILIKHPNVPINNDPNNTETLYSTYAHLSANLVEVGQEVAKGELIGKSGNSGNSTAPHLHFQIDKEEAPFHPYWPFTWKDQQNAGLSYFDAINNGLNKQNGYKYTIDPMEHIAQYENFQGGTLVVQPQSETQVTAVEVIAEPEEEELLASADKVEETEKEEIIVVRETVVEENTVPEPTTRSVVMTRVGDPKGIIIETDKAFIPGQSEIVRIRIEDENLVASNGIQLNTTLRNLAQITPSNLQKKDFENGVAEVIVKTDSNSSFKMIAEGEFGQIKSDSLRAYIFTDIPKTHQYGDAIQYLKDSQIVNGYSDGTFRPETGINRAEAVKILLTGNNVKVTNNENKFPDVVDGSWYEDFVTTAAEEGIVKGYGDGTFKPEQNVSRAEFLKVAIEAAGIQVPTNGDNFNDIQSGVWFEDYFRIAKRYNMLPTTNGGDVEPGKAITRGEASYIMYKIAEM